MRVRAAASPDLCAQLVSGVVSRARADGSFDMVPDAPATGAPGGAAWERLLCAEVVTDMPMAWIIGYGKGAKPKGGDADNAVTRFGETGIHSAA